MANLFKNGKLKKSLSGSQTRKSVPPQLLCPSLPKDWMNRALNPEILSKRWDLSEITLGQWRWNGTGPYYAKLGRGIHYPLEEIELFEELKLRRHTGERR